MLTQNIKKGIKDVRDILKRKKLPLSELINQITLIIFYKFMNYIDEASINCGGKPTYFKDSLEQYSWKNIMSKDINVFERFYKYSKGIKIFYSQNEIPQLFKDIFKTTRISDIDTLTLSDILNIIEKNFNYNINLEQLGDAYEYLLNIALGCQFRTPKHIVDFIIKVVNPKKTETIFDPICKTAEFLISSYKHILKNNTTKSLEMMLNIDEKKEILKHISGYNIGPSMVNFAKTNMFLHDFCNFINVYEYDILTDNNTWNKTYDVILSNPLFIMNNEIFFINYIINQLNNKGRGGIIVSEKIEKKDYKNLRKNIVENCLIAFVSMPNGVFYPYSNIKTNILFFDKKIAKDRKDILFVDLTDLTNVKNDQIMFKFNSFNSSDVIKTIKNYKEGKEIKFPNAFTVLKKKISNNNYCLDLIFYKTPNSIIKKCSIEKVFNKAEQFDKKINIPHNDNFDKKINIPYNNKNNSGCGCFTTIIIIIIIYWFFGCT